MKIQVDTETTQPETFDITEIFLTLKEQHRNVFIYQADSQVFIYRSLGRSEYKNILTDEQFDDFAKEELICQICTLWPEEYDFDNCSAGIPTVLTKSILKNSYLDGDNARRGVLDYYRKEMFDLDNQVTCLINEAFPQFDIEEIEAWDIDRTTKYLSRAEWKLHNLRGLPFIQAQGDFYENKNGEDQQEQERTAVHTEELSRPITVNKEEKEKTNLRGGSREKLTPEKLAQLRAQFPDIDWTADNGAQGVDGLAQDSIDVTAPALRPGW